MAKQVCDIKGGSGMSRGQSTEHLRDYKVTDPSAKKYGYYDPTRMGLNFEITRGGVVSPINKGYPIDRRFKDICKARGIEIPKPIKMKDGTEKERNTVAHFILGGSRDQMLKLAFGDQKVDIARGADNRHITRHEDIEKWAIDQYNLMAKLYGEENIVAFVVHLDEKNPHVHCTILPAIDGKISYNKVVGGRNKEEARKRFYQIHDAIAAVNAKWGLERGDNIQKTGAKHRTSEEYLLWLRDECNKLEQDYGDVKEKVSGMKDSLKLLEGEIRRQEIKAKGLTTMIRNLEQKQEDLEAEVLSSDMVLQQNEQTKRNLDLLIQSNQELLGKRRKELDDTKELLELLKKQHAEKLLEVSDAEKRILKLQKQVDDLEGAKTKYLDSFIWADIGEYLQNVLKELVLKEAGRFREKLGFKFSLIEEFDKIFANTYIPEIAENGDEVVRAAAELFLGKTGDVMDFASSVGGGNSPAGGWRKNDNEDDENYLYRCIGMALKFVRTSRGLRR